MISSKGSAQGPHIPCWSLIVCIKPPPNPNGRSSNTPLINMISISIYFRNICSKAMQAKCHRCIRIARVGARADPPVVQMIILCRLVQDAAPPRVAAAAAGGGAPGFRHSGGKDQGPPTSSSLPSSRRQMPPDRLPRLLLALKTFGFSVEVNSFHKLNC